MTRLRILPLFVLVIAVLLLVMGLMVVKPYEGRVAVPTPTITQTQVTQAQPSAPRWIKIDPVGNKTEGDIFTITSTTNLSAGEEVLVEIMNYEWRHPLYGSSDTVKVIPGVNGTNTISYTVNTTGYNPEKYLVHETCFGENTEDRIENETYFNITKRTTQPTSNQSSTPPWIRIDPIRDHYFGDVITITGTTTCNTGDIQTVITDNNWHPCQKSTAWCVDNPDPCCDGVRINVPIIPGKNGNNTWSIEVNTSQHNLYPGTFLVEVITPGCPMDEESYQEFYEYMNIRDVTDQPSTPRWWIRIDPIGDKQAGDNFTITSTTNLSAGEEIIVYVNLAQGLSLQNFSGCTGGVTVIPGMNGTNTISFPVRPSVCQNLIPAEYSISEFDMFNRASAQASFNITPGKMS